MILTLTYADHFLSSAAMVSIGVDVVVAKTKPADTMKAAILTLSAWSDSPRG